jgi:hypothetical protein
MSQWNTVSLAAAVVLGIACISTDALADRSGRYRAAGVYHGGVRGVARWVPAVGVHVRPYDCAYYWHAQCY